MELHRIKVFGERNTGTRAVTKMLRPMPHVSAALPGGPIRSTRLDALEKRIRASLQGHWLRMYLDAVMDERRNLAGGIGAWKHAAPQFDDSFERARAHIVFMVRDPYSWMVSFARRPYHIRASRRYALEDFIDTPWLTIGRDRLQSVLESPLDLWNLKLQAYGRFQAQSTRPCAVIRFEDFVRDPVAELGATLRDFGIPTDGLALIERSTKDEGLSHDEIRSYYQNDSWQMRLTQKSVTLINRFIDWEVAEKFGYAPMDPADFPETLPPMIASQIAFELSNGRSAAQTGKTG